MRTKNMYVKDNALYMGKFPLTELAEKYQTPLYVYDEVGLRAKMDIFKKYFQSDKFACHVVYATKAFLAPRLCKMLDEYGFYADGVSSGDMYLMEKSGFPMEHIVLHGNNKSDDELKMAIDKNVGYIVIDNYGELERLIKIASVKKKVVKTLIRINPGIEAHTHAYIETSKLDSKFGESIYDLELLEGMFNLYKENEYVSLEGFHAHIGSQINSADSFKQEAVKMAEFTKEMNDKYNLNLTTLDLGGGFGIKYLDDDKEINLQEMLTTIIDTVTAAFEGSNVDLKTLMIEPGRSLVGDNGITLYKVGGYKKTYAGVEYAFVDGGMPDNIRPALYQALYSLDIANRVEGKEKKVINVVGKCCESGDIVRKGVELPLVEVGDTLVVYSTGAYCYSMSMNYNGLTRGGVIFVDNDKVHEVIKKQSLEDLVSTCVFEE